MVAAPNAIPSRPGERLKTYRLDAMKLRGCCAPTN
jgi:hypothetical protein